MKRKKYSGREWLLRVAAVLFALGIWQIAATVINSRVLLVSPVAVAVRLSELVLTFAFWSSVGTSLSRIAVGFFAALTFGAAFAALSARFKVAEIFLSPYIAAVKATPVASFVVLCLLWLDAANLAAVVSFLIVFPVVYANLLGGIRSADRELIEVATVFGANWRQKLTAVYAPQLKPYLAAAVSAGAGMAWKSGVAAEVIALSRGSVGRELLEAKIYLNTTDLFAWTVTVIAASAVFEKAIGAVVAPLWSTGES
jgi:NitT/TauT family transport system permease protein